MDFHHLKEVWEKGKTKTTIHCWHFKCPSILFKKNKE